MVDGPLGAVVGILIVTAVGAVVVGAVLYGGSLTGAGIRLGRRLHLVRQPPPTPAGMPLERIARDLRRLRLQTVHEAGSPEARHRAVLMAYDGALADACRALGIETDLLELADGMEREAERFRVEVELQEAGVPLSDA